MIVVLGVEGRGGDGDGLVRVVGKDGERAGGVEADATDGGRVDLAFGHGAVNGQADAAPYVCSGLFLSGVRRRTGGSISIGAS